VSASGRIKISSRSDTIIVNCQLSIVHYHERRNLRMSFLKGKKVAILGDRDGIPGMAIEECVKSAGAEVVFSTTECFV